MLALYSGTNKEFFLVYRDSTRHSRCAGCQVLVKSCHFYFHILIDLWLEPGRLSGAKEARFKPPNEPPSGTDTPIPDADDDSCTALQPHEPLYEHQTCSKTVRQDHIHP